MVMIGMKLL